MKFGGEVCAKLWMRVGKNLKGKRFNTEDTELARLPDGQAQRTRRRKERRMKITPRRRGRGGSQRAGRDGHLKVAATSAQLLAGEHSPFEAQGKQEWLCHD